MDFMILAKNTYEEQNTLTKVYYTLSVFVPLKTFKERT